MMRPIQTELFFEKSRVEELARIRPNLLTGVKAGLFGLLILLLSRLFQ